MIPTDCFHAWFPLVSVDSTPNWGSLPGVSSLPGDCAPRSKTRCHHFAAMAGLVISVTVDGSDIPRPSTLWMYQTYQTWFLNRIIYRTNWCKISEPSTVACEPGFDGQLVLVAMMNMIARNS